MPPFNMLALMVATTLAALGVAPNAANDNNGRSVSGPCDAFAVNA